MEIKEIKERLTITTVLQHYGLVPTAKGALTCPFHEAKQGSRKKTMQIYLDTNRYQCFHKDCKAGNGDVIDFIQHKEGCTKHEAIEKAKALLGANVTPMPATGSSSGTGTGKDPGPKGIQDASRIVVPPSGTGFSDIKEALSDGFTSSDGRGRQVKEGIHLPATGLFTKVSDEQLSYQDEQLAITALGGVRLEGLDRLRVTLKIKLREQKEGNSIRHSLDLYNDDQVEKLTRKTAERLEIGTSVIRKALQNLTDHLENYRLEALNQNSSTNPETPALTAQEKQQAIAFLKEQDLMHRTNELLGESGIIGEKINRQILWLVYSSRKRPKPLHVICLGASGTGKTYLQEKVARFIPAQEKFTFTASTENAFYYLEPYDLCHKVVLIEDMDGVQYLLYPLRELQTKQWISKIVPMKDSPTSTSNKTRKLEVFGPICLSGTTTKEKIYEDNANRCLLLHLDNSYEQQEAIMDYQRKLSANKINTENELQAAQTLLHIQQVLQAVKVVNPYAEYLKIPHKCFKPLRTNEHYLQFIETVTWYHQYQREERADENGELYIETTLEDIETANRLMKEVLLTKSDELPKSIRSFFEALKSWLKQAKKSSFYSKEVRNYFRLYPMKANRYLGTLEQYDYIRRVGGNKKVGYEYEICDWDDYSHLQKGLDVLDELLETLRNEVNTFSVT